jgi:hypothetical protein
MPIDRSLESLRAEVEELRARYARMQADDRHQRRNERRQQATRTGKDDGGPPSTPFPSGSPVQ